MVKRKQREQSRKREPRSETPPIPAGSAGLGGRWRALMPAGFVLLLLVLLYPEPIFRSYVYDTPDTQAAEAFRQVGDASRKTGVYPLWNPYIFGGMPTFGSLAYTYGLYPPTLVFEWLQDLGLPPLTWLLGHLLCGGLGMWWLMGRWRAPWPARLLSVVIWLWSARLVAWAVHGHGSKLGAEMYLPWLVGLTWTILTRGGLRPAAVAALLLGLQFLRGHLQISFYTLLVMGFMTVWHLIWPLRQEVAALSKVMPGDQQTLRRAPRVQDIGRRARRAGLVALVVVLGFAIGSALLLPVHSYTEISTRGAGGASGGGGSAYDYATNWSLAPEDLGAVFLPAVAGFGKATYLGRMPFTENPNYLGFLVPVLAAAACLVRRRRSFLYALLALCILSVLLAMGRYSPGLYQLFYAALPYFDKFRVPSMILVLTYLALAVLAGLGAAALVDPAKDRSMWLRRTTWVLLAAGGLMVLLGGLELAQGGHRDFLAGLAARSQKSAPPVLLAAAWDLHKAFLIRCGLVLMLSGGACLLASKREGFRRSGLAPVLAVLVALDFWGVARLVTQPHQGLYQVVRMPDGGGRLAAAVPLARPWPGKAVVQVHPDLAAALQDAVGHGRLLPLGSDVMANDYMTAGIRSLGGYHPAKPAAAEVVRQRLFGRVPAGPLARWLGAAAVTYPEPLSAQVMTLLRDHGLDLLPNGEQQAGMNVYRIREPLPRARLLDSYVLAQTAPAGDALEGFLDAVATGRHDPASTVILDRKPVPEPQAGDQPLPEPVFLQDGLNAVVLLAETPRPAVLLLADLAAPGWRATIDGRPAELLRADHILRAVALPAGRHEVRFEFHDPALRQGLLLALAGLLGVAALCAGAWFARHRSSPGFFAKNECEHDGIRD